MRNDVGRRVGPALYRERLDLYELSELGEQGGKVS